MTDRNEPARGSDFVQSLERGMAVIRSFGADRPEQTLSDVARRTGVSRATARRLLLTLVELGYVRLDGRMFSLRPSILSLGYSYLSSLGLSEVVEPHIEELVETVQESSSVSILDDGEIVYVARVSTRRIMNVAISVGTRFPAHATSMGRVLLAGQPEHRLDSYLRTTELRSLTPNTIVDREDLRRELQLTRDRGWALVDQELEEGLRSLAAPIHDPDGKVVAAINISMSAQTREVETAVETLLPPLLEAAAHIEDDLPSSRVFIPDARPTLMPDEADAVP